jgi:hypothetical protein
MEVGCERDRQEGYATFHGPKQHKIELFCSKTASRQALRQGGQSQAEADARLGLMMSFAIMQLQVVCT